jgi:type IV secretory pathway TrbD component
MALEHILQLRSSVVNVTRYTGWCVAEVMARCKADRDQQLFQADRRHAYLPSSGSITASLLNIGEGQE